MNEEEHYSIGDVSPRDLLEFLMEQQGLKQADLADCAPQSRISEILNGKRTISKEIAKRFRVSVDLFI
jgi:HTH-type transcriptional regulator / antitoxin HigA